MIKWQNCLPCGDLRKLGSDKKGIVFTLQIYLKASRLYLYSFDEILNNYMYFGMLDLLRKQLILEALKRN